MEGIELFDLVKQIHPPISKLGRMASLIEAIENTLENLGREMVTMLNQVHIDSSLGNDILELGKIIDCMRFPLDTDVEYRNRVQSYVNTAQNRYQTLDAITTLVEDITGWTPDIDEELESAETAGSWDTGEWDVDHWITDFMQQYGTVRNTGIIRILMPYNIHEEYATDIFIQINRIKAAGIALILDVADLFFESFVEFASAYEFMGFVGNYNFNETTFPDFPKGGFVSFDTAVWDVDEWDLYTGDPSDVLAFGLGLDPGEQFLFSGLTEAEGTIIALLPDAHSEMADELSDIHIPVMEQEAEHIQLGAWDRIEWDTGEWDSEIQSDDWEATIIGSFEITDGGVSSEEFVGLVECLGNLESLVSILSQLSYIYADMPYSESVTSLLESHIAWMNGSLNNEDLPSGSLSIGYDGFISYGHTPEIISLLSVSDLLINAWSLWVENLTSLVESWNGSLDGKYIEDVLYGSLVEDISGDLNYDTLLELLNILTEANDLISIYGPFEEFANQHGFDEGTWEDAEWDHGPMKEEMTFYLNIPSYESISSLNESIIESANYSTLTEVILASEMLIVGNEFATGWIQELILDSSFVDSINGNIDYSSLLESIVSLLDDLLNSLIMKIDETLTLLNDIPFFSSGLESTESLSSLNIGFDSTLNGMFDENKIAATGFATIGTSTIGSMDTLVSNEYETGLTDAGWDSGHWNSGPFDFSGKIQALVEVY